MGLFTGPDDTVYNTRYIITVSKPTNLRGEMWEFWVLVEGLDHGPICFQYKSEDICKAKWEILLNKMKAD